MIKRSFFGLAKPQVLYERTDIFPMLQEVPAPAQATFFVDVPYERTDLLNVKIGDTISRGQKIQPMADNPAYVIASVAGTVSSVFSHTGNFGKKYTGITVSVDKDKAAATDHQFREAGKDPSLDTVDAFLRDVPGGLPEGLLTHTDKLQTIVIQGVDEDLLGMTRPYVVKHEMSALKRGIDILQKVTGVRRAVLTIPFSMASEGGASGAEVKTVKAAYPSANPRLVAKDCLGVTVPAGSSLESAGLCFISAEAVVSLGKAFENGVVPDRKTITVIKKNNEKLLVSAVLGTPVGDILSLCAETVNENDRIVFGGPMTGSAVFSENYPVGPQTDIIFVQDAGSLPPVMDRGCINCGECVRMCPANIPVNVLIRYLKAGEYIEAADRYDLLSCIECGLCAFVCTVNIPIFQYIKLGKVEFAAQNAAEADNA